MIVIMVVWVVMLSFVFGYECGFELGVVVLSRMW